MATVSSRGFSISKDQTPLVQVLSRGFDALCDPVVVTDDRGHILYANKMVEISSGYTREEVYQKTPGELWGGHMPRDFYNRLWHTIKEEKKPFIGEIRNTTKDGLAYWQELRITPILDEDGEARFYRRRAAHSGEKGARTPER